MATCSDSDDNFSSALILRIIYTSEEYSNWKPWRNSHVANVLLFVRDAVRWCINYGASLCKIIEKLTSRMLKRLKPGVLSAICERRGTRLLRHVALSLVLAVAHKPHNYIHVYWNTYSIWGQIQILETRVRQVRGKSYIEKFHYSTHREGALPWLSFAQTCQASMPLFVLAVEIVLHVH